MREFPYTVTVTDIAGNVVFVGQPAETSDTFELITRLGEPVRLMVDIPSMSAQIRQPCGRTEP